MTIDELVNLIKRIKYKPGFVIEVHGDVWDKDRESKSFYLSSEQHCMDPYHIHFKMPVIDADDPEFKKTSFVQKDLVLHKEQLDRINEQGMVAIIRHNLKVLESHECDEFFRLDGIKIYDPHKRGDR